MTYLRTGNATGAHFVAADFWIAAIVKIRGDLSMAIDWRSTFHGVSLNTGQSRPIVIRALEPKQAGFDGIRAA